MPSLKPRIRNEPSPVMPESAICVHTLRPLIGMVVERGTQLPIDHHLVRTYPDHFLGVVPLDREEVNESDAA
jgi:hypothetical protein